MMQVIKRSGRREVVSFDKITARLRKLTYNLDTNYVNLFEVSKKVIMGLYDNVTTIELDNLAAETAATMATIHPDYALLAARIAVSNLHKETEKSFAKVIQSLYNYVDPKTGERAGLISDEVYKIVQQNKETLDSAIIFDRDFDFDYFGFKTLERSYLLRMNGKVAERPQHLFHRDQPQPPCTFASGWNSFGEPEKRDQCVGPAMSRTQHVPRPQDGGAEAARRQCQRAHRGSGAG